MFNGRMDFEWNASLKIVMFGVYGFVPAMSTAFTAGDKPMYFNNLRTIRSAYDLSETRGKLPPEFSNLNHPKGLSRYVGS